MTTTVGGTIVWHVMELIRSPTARFQLSFAEQRDIVPQLGYTSAWAPGGGTSRDARTLVRAKSDQSVASCEVGLEEWGLPKTDRRRTSPAGALQWRHVGGRI